MVIHTPPFRQMCPPSPGNHAQVQDSPPADSMGTSLTALHLLCKQMGRRKIPRRHGAKYACVLLPHMPSGEQWERRKGKEAGSIDPFVSVLGTRVESSFLYGDMRSGAVIIQMNSYCNISNALENLFVCPRHQVC